MKYTSERKNKADDQMVKAVERFKNDTAKSVGDWGRADKQYAPGVTSKRSRMAKKQPSEALKESSGTVDTPTLLQGVLSEAVTFSEDVESEGSLTEESYGFVTPDGKNITGKNGGSHESIARKHGFGKGLPPHNHYDAETPARDAAIKAGWVRYRHYGDSGVLTTFDPSHQKAKANAYAHISKHPGRSVYTVNDHNFDTQKDALSHVKSLNEQELPIQKCNVCGESGHPASIHQAKALDPKNNVTEATKPHVIWIGGSAKGAETVANKLKAHYPNTTHGDAGHVYVHTDHPASHVAANLKKIGAGGYQIDDRDASPRLGYEKCSNCGKDHAPSVPCPKKKLLFGSEEPALAESFTVTELKRLLKS